MFNYRYFSVVGALYFSKERDVKWSNGRNMSATKNHVTTESATPEVPPHHTAANVNLDTQVSMVIIHLRFFKWFMMIIFIFLLNSRVLLCKYTFVPN